MQQFRKATICYAIHEEIFNPCILQDKSRSYQAYERKYYGENDIRFAKSLSGIVNFAETNNTVTETCIVSTKSKYKGDSNHSFKSVIINIAVRILEPWIPICG